MAMFVGGIQVTGTQTLDATKLTGNLPSLSGASLTSLNGGNISSGTIADARIPAFAASKITSGAFADARIPSLATSKITSGSFATDRIPNLSAAKITSGTMDGGRISGGTFSAVNGSNLTSLPSSSTIPVVSVNTVGSYSFRRDDQQIGNGGTVVSQSNDRCILSDSSANQGSSTGGTWRLHGQMGGRFTASSWQRIS